MYLFNKQYGFNIGNQPPKIYTDNIIENLLCYREDQHQIEGQDLGDLIPPLACNFSKLNPNILAVSDEDGGLLIFDVNKTGLNSVLQDWRAHENAVFDLDWMPGENKLVTASGDQSSVIWDITNEEDECTFKGHSSSVKTVRFRHDDKFVFATGSRDGHVMIWDKRTTAKDGSIPPINVIKNAHACLNNNTSKKKRQGATTDSLQTVTSVIFQDEYTLISAGSVDGTIKVWDLRKNYTTLKSLSLPKYKYSYAGSSNRSPGFSSLILDSSRTRLFASCMDNIIYQYDTAAYSSQPVCQYKGHDNRSFYVKTSLSIDDQYLLSGSSDNNACIWKVDDPVSSPFILTGHRGEVSSVAWCQQDITKLVTLSDDTTIRLWRMNSIETNRDSVHCVGKTERTHKDIGTSTSKPPSCPTTPKKSAVSKSNIPPPSPSRGRSVLSSPSKTLSSAVKASLVAMTTSNPDGACSKGGIVKNAHVISLKHWLQKPNHSLSPRKLFTPNSPRKLVVKLTPRKNDQEESTTSKPDTGKKKEMVARGIKRKLIENLDQCENVRQEKKYKTELRYDNIKSDSHDESKTTPSKNSKEVLKETINTDCPVTPKRTISEGNEKQWQSPTMNLPNYVLDPQPRAPFAKQETPKDKKSIDWLTKMRREKQESPSTQLTSPSCKSDMPGCSSPEVRLRLNNETTPKSSRRGSPLQKRVRTPKSNKLSIKQFFSPKSDKV